VRENARARVSARGGGEEEKAGEGGNKQRTLFFVDVLAVRAHLLLPAHTFTFTHTHAHTHTHTHTHTRTHTHTHTHTRTPFFAAVLAVRAFAVAGTPELRRSVRIAEALRGTVQKSAPTCIYVYVCIYIYVYTCTHVRGYAHTSPWRYRSGNGTYVCTCVYVTSTYVLARTCKHTYKPLEVPFTASFHLYASLCISIHLYPSLSISIHLHASLSIPIHLFPSPSFSVYLSLSLLSPSLSFSVHLSLSLSISLFLYPSLPILSTITLS